MRSLPRTIAVFVLLLIGCSADTVDDLKDAAGNIIDKTAEKVEEWKEGVNAVYEDAQETAKERWTLAEHKVGDKLNDLKDSAKSTFESAKSAASENVVQAKKLAEENDADSTSGITDSLKEAAKDTLDSAKEFVQGEAKEGDKSKKASKDKAKAAKDDAEIAGEEAKGSFEEVAGYAKKSTSS